MADCTIKSGEVVFIDDPRLNDEGCKIEPGAVIRPKPEFVPEEKVTVPTAAVNPVAPIATPIKKEINQKVIESLAALTAPEPADSLDSSTSTAEMVSGEAVTQAHVAPSEDDNNSFEIDTLTAAIVGAALALASAGAVSAGSISSFASSIKAKVATAFGSKGAVVTAATVTAGTIVTVKALEFKMSNLEKDMKKAKEEVGGAASSIDRIDELLNRLSGNSNNKLDPPV